LASIVTASRPAADSDGLEQRLDALVEAARRAWPTVALDSTVFISHLVEHLPADLDAGKAIDRVHAGDLYLACACARGFPEAISAFDREYLSLVGTAVARIDRSPHFVDEVRQRLRERLLVGSRPRIADYNGSGPLGGWVRVTAIRVALNAVRESKRINHDELLSVPGAADSPELDAIHRQYRPQVEAALRTAIGHISANDRELLRLHYIDKVSFERIGRLKNIDPTTVSRRIAATRRFVLAQTKRELGRLTPLTTASRDSLLMAVRSKINISLETLLKP
jgi:RNA polymerase sigma-70 factor (ECF subfamily)